MATIQDIADKLGVSKGTVSKAINNAPDISETLRKTILDTAVEMGYTRLRRQKNDAKRFCIIIENMEYEEPHQFGYDFIIGFRQMAEPAGYVVHAIPMTKDLQKKIPYDEMCIRDSSRPVQNSPWSGLDSVRHRFQEAGLYSLLSQHFPLLQAGLLLSPLLPDCYHSL